MYTRVVVMPVGGGAVEPKDIGSSLEGHAYDISLGGVRYELDHALPTGTRVDVEILLPGATGPIRGSGQVVRVFDLEDDPGPRRQAMRLDRFRTDTDRQSLVRLISDGWYGRPL
jgi:hypothetical protein